MMPIIKPIFSNANELNTWVRFLTQVPMPQKGSSNFLFYRTRMKIPA
jgi:hypothetical protein